ncbi:MAG: P-loop NTPase fold protein [Marinomonas foliarum]|uniref:P-loop NTPase fold protein n=1 Tax=Marinomonas foliarum TaxID=491950 RepID=UPI003F9EA0E6
MDHVRKYQNEKPVESDLFNGQGHKQVADAISKVLLHDNTQHIIGVEGSLGAGKSTVINILKQQVQDKGFHIVTFDADQHHTSMRPALIKVIETELSSMLGGRKAKGQEKLSKAVDTALGKRLTYTKDTNSHLPFSSIIFFFLFGISAWQVKPSISFLLDLNENISTKNQDPNQSISLDTASSGFDISNGFLSLALVAFPFVLFWLIKCFKKTTQLGDLIKRNSVDTITETIDINREVGSIELKEAFDSFAELIPENNVLLLVIDNIDRVAPDDARELWSDIETLISLGSEKLRILLPYSEEHLAKALEKSSIDEGQSGKEFISKRIPVPFSAPPIVTSGWHEQFNEYWGQTLPDIEGKDGVKALIDIWDRKITPRYLKSIINRIGAKIDSCPEHNDILNGVCCAAYIIVVKDHNLTINELLSKPDELTLPNFDDKSHDGLKRQLKAAQKVLRKHVGEKEKWSKQIAALHFQTSFAVAQSELISEPIKSAFLSLDSERLIELHPLYGFDLFFKKQIEDTHAIDLIKIAASLAGNEIGKAVLDAHLNDINHEIKEA